MGVETRKPPLPAPTESSTLQTSGGSGEEADLATDVSRRTDRTSYSLPEDGSPLTIPTKKRRGSHDKGRESALAHASHHSQTSLLIEYFEGGKEPNVHSRPSVRVKVTPSAARKIKDTNEHVQVTTSKGSRKPSYTRRISLGPHSTREKQATESADDKSISSYTSAAEESSLAHRYPPPVEVEIMHRDQDSDLSGPSLAREERYTHVNPSDISSMPPDSMLEGQAGNVTPRRGSRSTSRDAVVTTDTLKTPSRRRSRSLSKERLAHKAMEKLAGRPREVSGGKHKRSSKTRSRSVSNEQLAEDVKSRRRRSSKGYKEEESASGAESSLLTASQLSPRRESGDQYSFRSGTSKSSINANPRLLETVENAIRRLIMPELETLKQEQKMQQSRQKFDRDNRGSVDSGRSVSHTDLSRKLSKHASAPDVSGKPKVFLNRDEHNVGTLLAGDSIKGRKESRRDRNSDSPPERRSERGMSEETVIRDGQEPSRKRSKEHRLRDGATGALTGGILTAAALDHHDLKHNDSRTSIDREKRRRRRSKGSHSRSASIAESTEDIFNKHDVPPMPMRSDIHTSDVTRDSILSEQTDVTLSPSEERIHIAEIRQVSRGSPREILSPASKTATRTSQDTRRGGLGTHHSNLSQGDLVETSPRSNRSTCDEEHHLKLVEAGVVGAAAGTAGLTAHNLSDRNDQYDRHEFAYQHENRGLSPIQSVSSRQESEINRQSVGHRGSLTSLKQHLKKGSAASMRSLASPVSVDMTRSNRPKGINFEPGEDVLAQLRDSKFTEGEYSDKDPAMDEWLEQEHEKNDRYRDSGSYRDSMIDYKHMTNYTDDSMDAPYLDKVTAAQERQTVGAGRNPDYRSTPLAVESAVASLLETSVLSSKQGDRSFAGSREQDRMEIDAEREIAQDSKGEQLHEHQTKSSSERLYSYDRLSAKDSPRQSIAKSLDEREEHVPMGASGLPVADDPIPEIGHGLHSDSEISTNPSIIQGPMGGYQSDNRDHWPNKPTPPQSKGEFLSRSKDSSAHDSLKAAAAGFLSAAALASARSSVEEQGKSGEIPKHDHYKPLVHNEYDTNAKLGFSPIRAPYMADGRVPSPPKDEGYISGPQRGAGSPELSFRDAKAFNDRGLDGMTEDEDPFVSRGHDRHLSSNSHGLAHGMGSPLYDSATGGGMDRIQSKDIVALMDHVRDHSHSCLSSVLFYSLTKYQLTVRDAQRNARDTEILVTLVRSAAEMRNSFEEMKKFIAAQDDILVDTGNKQHDRTIQKIVLGGPRPQPLGAPKFQRRSSGEDDAEDEPAKKRNVFRRALKGLSSHNQNDIGKIEEMLVHLLGEVEGLKAVQGVRPGGGDTRADSLNLYNEMRAAGPDGYEPEGQAGTGSTGQSGYFSNPPSREASAMRNRDSRRGSQNRVSTVLEADEELDPHEQEVLDNHNHQLLTPTKENARAGSVPLDTPPQSQIPTGTQSNEHTPKTGTDKSRKHKSSSSSFFPKISRWSRTTASSVGENFRNSTDRRQQRPFSEGSRSGEDLQQYETNDHYDHHGDDRLRSSNSLEKDDVARDVAPGNRPPSPLIPSQVSEDPKYQAHRNSLNLQHPQPRPGPTHRFQRHLESQAQNFGSRSPISPTSDTFGSDPTLARYDPGATNRYSGLAGTLSPISDAGYSETSRAEQAPAPPRPPKVKDDGPLIPSSPSRPPKVASKDNRPAFASPLSTEHLQPEQRYSNGSTYDPVSRPLLVISKHVD